MSLKKVQLMGGALDGFMLNVNAENIYAGYTTSLKADNEKWYTYRYDGEHLQYVDDTCKYCGKSGEQITYTFEGGHMDGRVMHNTHLCGTLIKVPCATSCHNSKYRVEGARLIFIGIE